MPGTRLPPLCPGTYMPSSQRQPVQAAGIGSAVSGAVTAVTSALGSVFAGIAWWPWWSLLAVTAFGAFIGLAISKCASDFVKKEFDPNKTSMENRELREKIEELQQLVVKLEPLAYKSMQLRFTKGINKAVILGMVDQMLANKEVNIWWLPDEVERIIYFNMMTLMLSVLDEVVDGMSINFAGHNVRLQLTYLDLENGEDAALANSKTRELFNKALAPLPPKASAAAA